MTKTTGERAQDYDGLIIAIHIGLEFMASAVCLIPTQRTLTTRKAIVQAVRGYPGQDPLLERVPTRIQYSKDDKVIAVGAQADSAAAVIAWSKLLGGAGIFYDERGTAYSRPYGVNHMPLIATTASLLDFMVEHAITYVDSMYTAKKVSGIGQHIRGNIRYVLTAVPSRLSDSALREASYSSFNKDRKDSILHIDVKTRLHILLHGAARARHWLLSNSPAFTGAHVIVCQLGRELYTVVHTVKAETPRVITEVSYNKPIKSDLHDDIRQRCDAEVRRRILGARGSAATTIVALKSLQDRFFNLIRTFTNDGKDRLLSLAPDLQGVPNSKQFGIQNGQMHFRWIDLAGLFNDILAAVQGSLYGALAVQKRHNAPTNVYLLGLGPTNSPYFCAALQARMGSAVICTLVRGQDMESITAKGAATLFFDAQQQIW